MSLQYFQKNLGDAVNFLPVDKHGNFLQVDIIILDVCIQVCPKYPKQQVCNIFPIYQGKIDTIILGACGQACLYYPK